VEKVRNFNYVQVGLQDGEYKLSMQIFLEQCFQEVELGVAWENKYAQMVSYSFCDC
jgi:hypothetical protein